MWIFAVFLSVWFLMMIPGIAEKSVGSSLGMLGMIVVVLFGSGLQLIRTCIISSMVRQKVLILQPALMKANTWMTNWSG